jgi:hypothetical protein
MVVMLWRHLSTLISNQARAALVRGSAVILLLLTILSTVIIVKYPASNIQTISPSEFAVIKSNFADPCLLSVDGMFYAFATRPDPALHVQVASAKDISDWTLHEGYDAMPTLPRWALQEGDAAVWAPQVVQRVSPDHPNSIVPAGVWLARSATGLPGLIAPP